MPVIYYTIDEICIIGNIGCLLAIPVRSRHILKPTFNKLRVVGFIDGHTCAGDEVKAYQFEAVNGVRHSYGKCVANRGVLSAGSIVGEHAGPADGDGLGDVHCVEHSRREVDDITVHGSGMGLLQG